MGNATVEDVVRWNALAQRSTRERRRAEHMGFRFDAIRLFAPETIPGIVLQADFSCVCGRSERLQLVRPPFELLELPQSTVQDLLDPALQLRELGSFSRSHLESDGFAMVDVERIVHLGREFDQAHPPGPLDRCWAEESPSASVAWKSARMDRLKDWFRASCEAR